MFADTNDLIIYGLPGGLVVKNLPAVLENKVQSLGWEDPLEKEEANPLQGEISWTEEPGSSQSTGSQNSQTRLSN